MLILEPNFNSMKKYLFAAVLLKLLLQPAFSFSQEKYNFTEEAGLNAAVYRGVEAPVYQFRYQGSPYAYSDSFAVGSLVYNDVEYRGLLLNLNAHKDELHLRLPAGGKVIELDKRLVERFEIGSRRFVSYMGETAMEGLSEGFYEVLYSGKDMLLKKNVRGYYERLQTSGKGVFRYFDPINRYYIVKDGTPVQISRMKDFAKVYKEEKKAIKVYIRKNRIRFIDMEDKDLVFREIMSFTDNN